MSSYGARSPILSPELTRSKFDTEAIKAYMNKLLTTTLSNKSFPPAQQRHKLNEWSKEIGTRVREQMIGENPHLWISAPWTYPHFTSRTATQGIVRVEVFDYSNSN